jgi:conjugal transfer pilus assembly protein TraW
MRKVIMGLSTIICIEAKDILATDKGTKDAVTRDLGVYGEVFPVIERSLLEVIKAKLQALSDSGKLFDHQNAILQKTRERLSRPEPVGNVHKTITPRSFAYDPSITVTEDLKDHEGNVFHRKGTKVNPLETRFLPAPLLFVDGDDETQVAWAIQQFKQTTTNTKPKIILIKGAPFDLSEKLSLPVYFDQSGVLIKKFGIAQVPARVTQKDKILWVEEAIPEQEALSPLPRLRGEG